MDHHAPLLYLQGKIQPAPPGPCARIHLSIDDALPALLHQPAGSGAEPPAAQPPAPDRRPAGRADRFGLPQDARRVHVAFLRDLLALADQRLPPDRDAPPARRALRRMQRQAGAHEDALTPSSKDLGGHTFSVFRYQPPSVSSSNPPAFRYYWLRFAVFASFPSRTPDRKSTRLNSSHGYIS